MGKVWWALIPLAITTAVGITRSYVLLTEFWALKPTGVPAYGSLNDPTGAYSTGVMIVALGIIAVGFGRLVRRHAIANGWHYFIARKLLRTPIGPRVARATWNYQG